MQTPADINETELISNDLPYAGLLAWQGTAYSWDNVVADQMSLFLCLSWLTTEKTMERSVLPIDTDRGLVPPRQLPADVPPTDGVTLERCQ